MTTTLASHSTTIAVPHVRGEPLELQDRWGGKLSRGVYQVPINSRTIVWCAVGRDGRVLASTKMPPYAKEPAPGEIVNYDKVFRATSDRCEAEGRLWLVLERLEPRRDDDEFDYPDYQILGAYGAELSYPVARPA